MKKDFYDFLGANTRVDLRTAKMVYVDVLNAILAGLREYGEIDLPILGTFRVHEMKARKGYNIRQGTFEERPSVQTLKFTPNYKMKERIKGLDVPYGNTNKRT